MVVVLVAGLFVFGALTAESSAAVQGIVGIVLSTVVFIGMPAIIETMSHGRSLGKVTLGLRVVRDDGGPATARHALVRALIGYVEIYLLLGIPALVTSMIHPRPSGWATWRRARSSSPSGPGCGSPLPR